jgi:hypothetical protein
MKLPPRISDVRAQIYKENLWEILEAVAQPDFAPMESIT